jgi:flagellar basal-body rod modification protein FlgD
VPIDPTGSPTTTATRTVAAPSNQLGSDAFMKLMIAQLKYQNPMSPTDGTQLMAQTAQLTMVEKLTALAEQSERLVRDNQSLAAASLLGRTVSWADGDGGVQHGVVTSAAFGSSGAAVLVGGTRIPFDQIRDVTS